MLSDRQNPVEYFSESEVRDRFGGFFLPKNPLYRSNATGAAYTTVIGRFDTEFHSDF